MSRRATLSYTLSMQAGTEIPITVPTDPSTGKGFFPLAEEVVLIKGQPRNLVLGFAVEFETVGTVERYPGSEDTGELKIKYKQLLSKENRIHFFSDTGEHQLINIVTIPVHDHSSIYQGGPAYGTYFTTYSDEEPQTNG